MKLKKISVCVPAYNRVDTLIELINSFDKQKYPNKELVITDDSTSDVVKKEISKLKRKDIIYQKNKENIGFTQNLKKCLLMASGDFIVILGDDDVLFKQDTLTKYVNAFGRNKNIHYVYSNQVQFNEELDIEYEINMFDQNKYFPVGEKSFKELWLTSIFIGGLSLKNDKKIIEELWPKIKILHPQVEFAGNLLAKYGAYTIKDNLIGFRSRKSQFIFRALNNKKERQAGKHQNTELYEIFERVKKQNALNFDGEFIFDRLIKDAMILYPKEKMILGNKMLLKNHRSFIKISNKARTSQKLRFILWFSLITPSFVIFLLRKMIFLLVKLKNKNKFDHYKRDLDLAIS